mmetsp:Transcript_25863/g.33448  ORF Transcript_25863/g.33448 Transcript_25863/m.33448 type:complete len:117 (+) Transcript_25863:131-481(+)
MDRFLGKSLTPPSVVKAAHTRPAVDFPKGKMRNNKNFKVFDPNLLQKYQWLRQEENGLLFCVACKVDPRANQKIALCLALQVLEMVFEMKHSKGMMIFIKNLQSGMIIFENNSQKH